MFKKKKNKPGQGNGGSGNVGGAQALIVKGKEAQKTESRLPVAGKGQASSSPISKDGNDKELLNSICQLHRQIKADHTPAKDIMSAIGKLKTEIQNLIRELDESEENTEAPPKGANSKPRDRNATASGTNNSNDLYTVATTTRNKCRKLNSDLVITRKELKEISELAVAVGQEAGFMPDTRNVGKDSLKINAKGALEDIKQRNKALSEELHKLRQNIESYSTDQTEQQPKQQHSDKNQQPSHPRKQPQTTNQAKKKDHKSSQVNTNLEIVSKAVSTFDDLRLYKRELKKISELAVTVGQEVGFQPDTSNADKQGLSFNATEALEYIKQRNTVLSEELNNLRKNIESYSTDQTEQQPKQPNDKNKPPNRTRQQPQTTNQPKKKKDQSEDKKDHKSSQFNTNLEIISKVVSRFDDLQQYKSQMGPLVQSTIRLCMWKEDNPINDESVFVQLGRAVKDIDVDLKNYCHLESEYRELKKISELAVTVGQEVGFQPDRSNADKEGLRFNATKALEYIKQRNTILNQQLDILREKTTTNPTYLNAQQQPEEKQQKERKIQENTQKGTDKAKNGKDQSENKKDQKGSREGQKESREAQNEASGRISPFQFDTNIQIVSDAVVCVGYLQNNKITLESKLSQVLDFAVSLEEMNAELIGSVEGGGALNPTNEMEAESKKDEERSKRKKEGHDGSKADPPVAFDNKKFEQAIKLLPKVYEKLKDELSKMDHLAKRTIQLAMKEGDQPIQDKTLLETKNRDEIQKLKREIERKVKENEVLHNRLSKLAGNKMTEGNPNIANLGDPNRPTKIAEVYSEIYDNEWTDTLDVCLKKLGKEYSEDEALQALNKTLIICYKICEEKSDEWIQKTKEVLKDCLNKVMVDIQSDEILMQIKEGRKVDPDKMSQQLLKEIRPKKDIVATKYAKEMNSSKLYKMIIQNKFFEKCFTLCWKMIVQNPRMILVEGPSKGEKYDRNIFREFTSSGSKVVFTVWPALYLHEDGPLLVKGVVKVK